MEQKKCFINECDAKPVAKGLCNKHYQRVRTHGDPNHKKIIIPKTCSVEGCNDKHIGKGWCDRHRGMVKRNGSPILIKRSPLKGTPKERFFQSFKINERTNCWEWDRFCNDDGYGKFNIGRRLVNAHRFSYEIHIGPITKGLLVCHTCDNPSCVNPDHLWMGSDRDNSDDKIRKGRHLKPRKLCTSDGCNEVHKAKGLCRKHYHERKKDMVKNDKEIKATIIGEKI